MIKYSYILIFLVGLGFFSCSSGETRTSTNEVPTENILFIGNSYTYRNNGVDQMLSKIMSFKSRDKNYHFERAAKGKYRLSKHWNDPDTWKVFNSRKWDKVVLQEYSNGPIRDYDEFMKYGKMWSEEIRKQNPEAKIYLYSTWGYKHTAKMADSLFNAYNELGKKINADVIPIGMLWKKVKGKIDLYEEDGAHPNPRGTYLNACMFYKYIFDGDLKDVGTVKDPIEIDNQKKIKNWVGDFKTDAL